MVVKRLRRRPSRARSLTAVLARNGTACLLLGWPASTLWAQMPPGAKDPTALRPTATWRVRIESWDWFATDQAETRYTFVASLFRVGVSQARARWDWRVEGAQPALLGLPSDATAPPPQGQSGLGAAYRAANDGKVASVFLKQAFARFRLDEGGTTHLRLGRFEFGEGGEAVPRDPTLASLKRERIAERLVGPFGFTHVGRSFDGVEVARSARSLHLVFMAGRATAGVFRLDGMGWAETDVAYGAVTRPGRAAGEGGEGSRARADLRLFALGYRDGRGVLKVDNRPTALRSADTEEIRIFTLGGHYLRAWDFAGGKLDLTLWAAAQAGDWGMLRHRAAAFVAEVGVQPEMEALKPWIRAGLTYGSGDGDPADGGHGTFFQVLPTPRLYARFPFFNMMNSEDAYVQLFLRPHARSTLRAEAHRLRVASRADLWYAGGGAFEAESFGYAGRPTGGERSLATLLELSVDYRASSRASLGFYLGRALGADVVSSIYPDGPDAWFGFAEMRWQLF